jgi:hypothetical protein
MCSTTARSCAMKRYAMPRCCCKSLEQIDDLRLHGNIQRAHRLVADDQFRLDRQRARDADALALAAGKFMRITLRVNRVEADALSNSKIRFCRADLLSVNLWMSSASPTICSTVMRGLSEP